MVFLGILFNVRNHIVDLKEHEVVGHYIVGHNCIHNRANCALYRPMNLACLDMVKPAFTHLLLGIPSIQL